MSNGDDLQALTIFEGGVLGHSPAVVPIAALVGPSSGAEFNTLVAGLIPIACFRVDNVRFAFGSSFIDPGIEPELARLGGLLAIHPPASMAARAVPPRGGAPLSVFGHADPSGDDEFNKRLSGRRARAVHALLVRDVDAWNDLYAHPVGDDAWGLRAIRTMTSFLDRAGEAPEGFDRNPVKRKALFADYMERLCGQALPALERGDFLGGGADAGGKGDFQGCGEFNPLLIFSDDEQKRFAAQQDKTERNAANIPNRRVMVLIFREGSRVDPAQWPCPRASEGSGGCRKRFWSDGEQRRTRRLAQDERKFETSADTFACRFYHRLSIRSPCERVLKSFLLQVRLYSGFGNSIADAPFTVSINGRPPTPIARADAQGIVRTTVRDVTALSECTVDWGFVPIAGQQPELRFTRRVFIVTEFDSGDDASVKRLANMGYDDDTPTNNLIAFQLDYGHLAKPALDTNGQLDGPTAALIRRIYEEAADELRSTGAA